MLTSVTVQLENKDLQFQDKGGVSKASVNMYGRITSMARRPVSVWEEPVVIEAPTQMLSATQQAVLDLSALGVPGARHVPAERGGQGRRGRQP